MSFSEFPPPICVELGGACYLGNWKNSSNDTRFASFQGVRYAKSPTNDLRFKAPELFQSGEALWDVSGDSMIMCPQPALFEKFMIGVEDCLSSTFMYLKLYLLMMLHLFLSCFGFMVVLYFMDQTGITHKVQSISWIRG